MILTHIYLRLCRLNHKLKSIEMYFKLNTCFSSFKKKRADLVVPQCCALGKLVKDVLAIAVSVYSKCNCVQLHFYI